MSMKSESRIFNTLRRVAPALLLTLAYAGVAQAGQPAPIMPIASPCTPPTYRTYLLPSGTVKTVAGGATDPSFPFIKSSAPTSTWTLSPASTGGCDPGPVCIGLSVSRLSGLANRTEYFSGTVTTGAQTLDVTAGACTADFTFKEDAGGSGWGDPHLTTVDGVKYDFQSAGEFTALREKGFVVQTRQTPVPTATVPITNAYTGITHCVAIYTAVAAKLGTSRVTVEPSAAGEANLSTMLVRVNGKVVELGDAPYVLHSGGDKKDAIDGTITKHPDGLFEITDAFGTQLVVNSAFWDAHKVWYLNVSVYGTSAHEGTMGRLAAGSWLPALPDGSSLGAKPASETDRYKALYEKFADAWRVTDATSLFDYEAGTNTATFTRKEWPRNHPESCAIEGQKSAEAATEEVAQQACAHVVNATRKADCVFDVMVTGNTGFGKSYEVAQGFSPLPPGWFSPVPVPEPKCDDGPKCKDCPLPQQPWWCCTTVIVIGIIVSVLLIVLLLRKKP